MSSGPQEGELAPDFVLRGVPDGEYRLSSQRGRPVVLAFYPGDFTPVCTTQLSSYATDFDTFAATGAVLWGISTDDLEKHERFAKARALGFPLLSDPDGAVSNLYGVRGLLGRARRSIFVIDAEGRIAVRREEALSLTYRELDEIVGHVRALESRSTPGP